MPSFKSYLARQMEYSLSAVTFSYQVSLIYKLKYQEPEIHSAFSAACINSENKGFAAAGIS